MKRLANLDPSTRLIFFYYLFMNNSGYILTQNTLKLVVSVFIKLKGANDTKSTLVASTLFTTMNILRYTTNI